MEAHHILFTRKVWCAQESTKTLRNNRWLIPRLDPDTHKEVHKHLALMPVFDHFMASRVLRDFYPQPNDYLATMDNLMFAVDDALRHPKIQVIERGIGELAIAAIELQKPFIREGTVG